MNFIKKNKMTLIVVVIFLLLVLLLVQLKEIFFPAVGTAIYGNRLAGIKDVNISPDTIDQVKDSFKEDGVSKVSTRISGRTVEIMITVNPDVSLETAKSYGNKSLESFSESQKNIMTFKYLSKRKMSLLSFLL